MYAAYDASVDELIPSDGTLSAQRIEGFGDRLVLDADAPDNSTEPKDLYWNMYVMTPKAGAENSSGLGLPDAVRLPHENKAHTGL